MLRTANLLVFATVTLLGKSPSRQFMLRFEPMRPIVELKRMTDEDKRMSNAHSLYIRELYDVGTCSFAGEAFDRTGFYYVAIITVPDNETAETILANDPGVKSHYFRGEVIGFRTSLLKGGKLTSK